MDVIYYHGRQFGGPSHITSSENLFKRAGIYTPVLVQTDVEKDYLDGLGLMWGKEMQVHVLGKATYTGDLPWTYLSIVDLCLPEPSQYQS